MPRDRAEESLQGCALDFREPVLLEVVAEDGAADYLLRAGVETARVVARPTKQLELSGEQQKQREQKTILE